MNKNNVDKKVITSYQKLIAIYLIGMLIMSAFVGFSKNVRSDGTGNYPPPETGDWIIGEETHVWNETREIYGDIKIIDGGNLTLDNVILTVNGNITIENLGIFILHGSTIKMNCSIDLEYHIEVKSGGTFHILDFDSDPLTEDFSLITDGDFDNDEFGGEDYEFQFVVRKGATFVFKNSILSECGYIDDPIENSGLYIETDDALIEGCYILNNHAGIASRNCNFTISNNIISDNFYGIMFDSSNSIIMNNKINKNYNNIFFKDSDPLISNNNISDGWQGIKSISSNPTLINNEFYNLTRGIYCEESIVKIMNSTFYNCTNADVFLETNSIVTLINSTSEDFNAYFNDDSSTLYSQWYLDVKVEDTNNVPIYGVSVSAKDLSSNEIFNGKTGINGWKKGIICTEYSENKNGKTLESPHIVNVEKEGFTSNWTEIDFTSPNNQNHEINLKMLQLAKSQIGHSVSYAGDINNDGFEDVIVGAPNDDTNAKESGAAYIFFGYPGFETSDLDIDDANVTLFGSEAFENFGHSVSYGGDINNDDFDDLIIGAPNKIQQGGLTGEYFNYQGGANYADRFNDLKLKRKDQTINFDWGNGAPSSEVNADNFAVRWTGIIYIPEDNDYTFYMLADDTTRLEIDDTELFYDETSNTEESATFYLKEGFHKILAEMTEGGGGANAYLNWESSTISKQIIPQENLFIDIGAAYLFFGSDSMNKTIFSAEADAIFLGKNTGERFGSSVAGVGNVNGDEYDDFLIGGYGNNNAYLIYGGEIFKDDSTFFANLWDDDLDGIVDFTDNINSTGNTWGPNGDDDGWDTSPVGIYGGSETEVRYNPSSGAQGDDRSIETVDELQIEIGGGSNNGGRSSGAYGVEINITQKIFDNMNSAILKFDWKLIEYGHEDNEVMWIKARFGNSSQMNYLGSNLDGGADGSNEILYFPGDGGTNTQTGTFNEEIKNLITEPGSYYLELGGKNTAWTTGSEYMVAAFDDVSFSITEFGSPKAILEGQNMGDNFGFSLSPAGDVNKDTYSDFIIGAPDFNNMGKVYLYYGHENMGKDLIANSTIIGKGQDGKFGFSVDSAGDMNGDGYDDIIIGAPESGESYIYYGGEGGIDYSTIILDSTRDFNSGTPDNVSIGSDEVKLGISGNIIPNGFFDDGWEHWIFTDNFEGDSDARRNDQNNGMVSSENGDWKVGPISGGPTAGFGSDRDTIGGDNNANKQCSGRIQSEAFTIPGDVDYLHTWHNFKCDGFDDYQGYQDGYYLSLRNANNDNKLIDIASWYADGNYNLAYENEEEIITDISSYHGQNVYITLEINCNNGQRDKALAQLDDIYSCDSAGNPADPSLFGNYTSKIFKTEASIKGIIPNWDETLNGGNIEIKFRADSSVSWDDAQIAKNYDELIFDVPGNEIQFRASLTTPNNQTTPILHKISFEYYSNKNQTVIVGNSDDKFGYSVSYGGDINNDGYTEIIVGAPFNNANGNNAGAAYVFYGDGSMKNLLTINEAFSTYYGEGKENYFGFSVSNAGNIDNKDMKEIIIGAPYFENKKGKFYVISVKEDDVGILVINSPLNGELINADQSMKINMTLANFGINPQNNFKVELEIKTEDNLIYDYTANIMISTELEPGRKRFIEFNWMVPEQESYSYSIRTYTTLTGDMETSNDEKTIIVIVRGTDFRLNDVGLKRGDGVWIGGELHPIANQPTTIIANVTNIGVIDGINVEVSFYDGINLINSVIIANLSVLEIETIEILWDPTEGVHELRVEVDPDEDFIEYDEENNIKIKDIQVNSNIPGKPFIFWTQVNYNWGSKEKVVDAPVTVKNMRNGEILAVNRTSDDPKGKCRFILDENQYFEGDMLEIIATNPVINEGVPGEEIPEGTYFNGTTIFAYSDDSNDNQNSPYRFNLEPFGLIVQTILDEMNINIGGAARYSIFIKVAPQGNENEIVYLELPDIPDEWTVFISGEGVSSIDEKYMINVGEEIEEVNLIVVPPEIPTIFYLETDVIASIESFGIPKYPITFSTKIDKTDILLKIEGDEEKTVDPGDIITYDIKVTNKGTIADTVSLVLFGINTNWASLSESEILLGTTGESKEKQIQLFVDVPETAKYPDIAQISVYAISKDGRVSNINTTITNVREKIRSIDISLENSESDGNRTIYILKIENVGDMDEIINLEVLSPQNWNPKLNDTDLFLGIGDMTFITLTLSHPSEEKYWGEIDDFIVKAYYDDTFEQFQINKPPFANIALKYQNTIPNTVTIESTITVDGSYSKDEDTLELVYTWDFGDGTSLNGKETTHKYEIAGNFTITLTIEDKIGLIDIMSRDVKIANYYSPTLKVTYPLNESINVEDDIITVEVNEPMILDASESYDKDGYIVNYIWDFGTEVKYGDLIYWNYTTAGDYQIELTVEDNFGKKIKMIIDVNVTIPKEITGKDPVITDDDDGIAAWVYYSIFFIIAFLVVGVVIAFIKVKSVDSQIGQARMNFRNLGDIEQREYETPKPLIPTEEEKIKDEFTNEVIEVPEEENFFTDKKSDFTDNEPDVKEEEFGEPIEEGFPVEQEQEFKFDEPKEPEIKESNVEETPKSDKKVEEEDDFWTNWERE